MTDFQRQLAALKSAEDFFDFFRVPYETKVLASQRLQIMKRLRCVLAESGLFEADEEAGPVDEVAQAEAFRAALVRVYQDCRDGTGAEPPRPRAPAADEDAAPGFVPLTAIRGARRKA